MTKILALLAIGLVCIIVNVRGQATDNKKDNKFGQSFDEIVVSSDLNVRRKSKENRQGKKLLTNVPSGTTGPPGSNPTENVSRLVSSDGSRITKETRERRNVANNRLLDLGVAGYLLNSRKR